MTKILIDRAVVEQALEALELYVPKEDYENRPVGNVIDALRAALAEPQEPDSPERRCGGPGCDGTCCQPVEEPIGYLWPTGRHPDFRFTQQKRDGIDGTPVYTSPPQRKPLTEEEIWALYYALPSDDFERSDRIDFARAIERAHGIGGEG